MSKYCITAANHKNTNNHCASQFKVWQLNTSTGKWSPLGGKTLDFISNLLAAGDQVLSAKETETSIITGSAVEVELRIAKNETDFHISQMPTF